MGDGTARARLEQALDRLEAAVARAPAAASDEIARLHARNAALEEAARSALARIDRLLTEG